METRSKNSYCIGRRAGKSGPRLPVNNQTRIGKYAAGTNSSPEHPDGFQNLEKPSLDPLDLPSPQRKQKPNRTKWKRKEYKQVMIVFYQALNESKNKNTKRTYEIWRKEVGEHRPYIDANKLANVRRDIINKKRLKETEIEDIKKTVRKQTKTEKPKPEDVAGKNGKLKTKAERKKAGSLNTN